MSSADATIHLRTQTLEEQAEGINRSLLHTFKKIKLVWGFVILLVMASVLSGLSISLTGLSEHRDDTRNIGTNVVNCQSDCWRDFHWGNTSCTYQFDLGDSILIHLCNAYGHRRIDIRYFLLGEPTIKGIYLTVKQWNSFLLYVGAIDRHLS